MTPGSLPPLRAAAAVLVFGFAVACQHPTAPTPPEIEPAPEPAPAPPTRLTVRLSCEPASCEAETGASILFVATAGGGGGYEYSWRVSRGTLVGPTTERGAQRWVAPGRPGVVTVSVEVAGRGALPATAGMQVLVQPEEGEPGEPGGGTSSGGAPSLACSYSGHDVYECRRAPRDGSVWLVTSGARSWTLWPGGGRLRVAGSSAGWLEATPSGSTLQIRPSPSMQADGCRVQAHGLSAPTC